MEERIIELEIRSSFQQEKINSLSDAVFAQLREIEKLEKRVAALERRLTALATLAEGGGTPPADETPPHY